MSSNPMRSKPAVSEPSAPKVSGAYYTPAAVVETLLHWALRQESDRLLDPSCGDGRFIAGHRNSVGIEQDQQAAAKAIQAAPWALVHEGDFFAWVSETTERFDCSAGNPPFIRYQTFKGEVRERALSLCRRLGAVFSGLASSWAPFLVATASVLRSGGRMAFVVPAEIGHAPYAQPVLEFFVRNFSLVHIVAYRQKLFPELSEDCWLLYADGFGGSTENIRFSALDAFRSSSAPPRQFQRVPVTEWRSLWGGRLRPYLLSSACRTFYQQVANGDHASRLGDLAKVGIGYVTGANDFFHLRPSDAERLGIPRQFLMPTVRRGASLPARVLTRATLRAWETHDEQMLLLRLQASGPLPREIARYLDTQAGHDARTAFKCRNREPWYAVPDVQVPNFFLSYMSGLEPSLVRNDAECSCTNSVHAVRLKVGTSSRDLLTAWGTDFVRLSTEIQGHPLGGGMLKLEPREATQIVIPQVDLLKSVAVEEVTHGLQEIRRWRGVGNVL